MSTLLNVNNYHYRRGGADVMYLEQSMLFRDAGWQVAEFAMEHPENEPSRWQRHFVDEIEFGRSYTFGQQVVRAGRVVYSRQAQRRLGALLDEVRPDVAHLHNIYHHISPSILPVLSRRGVPTVLTTHDLKLACPSYQMLTHDGICERCRGGRVYNVVRHRCVKESRALSTVVFAEAALHRLLKTFTRHVDRFVTPSRFYRDKFVEWGFDPSAFVHVPNYVRADRFEPATSAGDGVVYAGRLAPEKGLRTLVRASALSGVPVRLAGTGPEAEALAILADELDAPVDLVGYQSGQELHDLITGARATVLPSEWYENAPVSILESYALGVPVIGARVGGITELVRADETGLLFESGSVDQLADALRSISERPRAAAQEMGRAGRSWVVDHFSADAYVDRMIDVYREVGVTV